MQNYKMALLKNNQQQHESQIKSNTDFYICTLTLAGSICQKLLCRFTRQTCNKNAYEPLRGFSHEDSIILWTQFNKTDGPNIKDA